MKAAVIQLVSGVDVDRNLQASRRLIEQAASQGAELVVLPENFASMEKVDIDKLDIMEPLGKGKIQRSEERRVGKEGRSRWSPYR